MHSRNMQDCKLLILCMSWVHRCISVHHLSTAGIYLDTALQLLPALAKQLTLHVCLQHSSKMSCLMPEELYSAQPLLQHCNRHIWGCLDPLSAKLMP